MKRVKIRKLCNWGSVKSKKKTELGGARKSNKDKKNHKQKKKPTSVAQKKKRSLKGEGQTLKAEIGRKCRPRGDKKGERTSKGEIWFHCAQTSQPRRLQRKRKRLEKKGR